MRGSTFGIWISGWKAEQRRLRSYFRGDFGSDNYVRIRETTKYGPPYGLLSDFVSRIFLFLGEQFQDALTLGLVRCRLEQVAVMPDFLSSDKSVHRAFLP